MNIKDLLEFVKTHNLSLDTELGFISEGYYGTGRSFTILTNGLGDTLLCIDEDDDYSS